MTIEQLEEFWGEVKYVWENGFMGIDIGNVIIALAIFFGFLVVRGLFSKYLLFRLHKLAMKSETQLDDQIIRALIPPIKFVPIIMGLFFGMKYLEIPDEADALFTNVIRSLIAFTIFWALHRALEPIGYTFKRLEKVLSKSMVQWMFKALKIFVIFIGSAVILEIWGIAVGPLLAGFGLFGVAVALGAQDLFKNLISGLTIIAEKRFHPGEWIKVDGVVEGTVEDIGFRSTKVRRFDKAPVHVPNAQLSDAVVTNFSRMSHRRIYWMIGITYSTSTEQLKVIRDGILGYLEKNSEIFDLSDNVSTFVRVDSFNASSIDIMLYCFTKTTDWGEWLEIKEALAFEIKRIVEEDAKSGFAFPSQSVYIESLPSGEKPEIFKAPAKKRAPKKAA